MNVQVEVHFTIQHGIEELRDEFVLRGHVPDWKVVEGVEGRPSGFIETRVVSVNLATQEDRQAWFVFSLEACGELRRSITIPHVVPSHVSVHIADLSEFLAFCRTCLVSCPGSA